MQHFVGLETYCEHNYGMVRESEGPDSLLDFFRQEGVPTTLVRDNSKMQTSKTWNDYLRRYWVKDGFIEPYYSHQNPAETDIRSQKEMLTRLMILSGCDSRAWYRAVKHVEDIRNHLARKNLGWRCSLEARDGETQDITGLLCFLFWSFVYYKDHTHSATDEGGNERLGRWMGRAKEYGDGMAYWILDVVTEELVVRSMVRAVDDVRPNAYFTDMVKSGLEDDSKRREEANFPLVIHEPGDKVTNDNGSVEVKNTPYTVKPEDLLDLNVWEKYTTKHGNERELKGTVVEQVDDRSYRVEFANGKQKVYEYEDLINQINHKEEDGAELWEFDALLDHRWSKLPGRKGKIDVKVKWAGYDDPTWEPMEVIKKDDPITLAKYAKEQNLLDYSIWKWARSYSKNEKKYKRLLKQARLMKKRTGKAIKYQFGIRVPRNIREAYVLDSVNGDTKWHDAIEKEVKMLKDVYPCFRVPDDPSEITQEYQKVPLLWVFAAKFDGRARARCVCGGHVTDDIEFDIYCGVVDLETVRTVFLIAVLHDLQIIAGDISSAYLQSMTMEKLYCTPGPEFKELSGIIVIIVRAMYGAKLSSHAWWQVLSNALRGMGFFPSKANFNMWMRARTNHYEYVGVIVDDLLVFSKDPHSILGPLEDVYGFELQGVGVPEYYSGADIRWNENAKSWEWMSKTYVSNVCSRIEKAV